MLSLTIMRLIVVQLLDISSRNTTREKLMRVLKQSLMSMLTEGKSCSGIGDHYTKVLPDIESDDEKIAYMEI